MLKRYAVAKLVLKFTTYQFITKKKNDEKITIE